MQSCPLGRHGAHFILGPLSVLCYYKDTDLLINLIYISGGSKICCLNILERDNRV